MYVLNHNSQFSSFQLKINMSLDDKIYHDLLLNMSTEIPDFNRVSDSSRANWTISCEESVDRRILHNTTKKSVSVFCPGDKEDILSLADVARQITEVQYLEAGLMAVNTSVIGDEAHCFLIMGGSGSGKTACLLEALCHGLEDFKPLGAEVALLRGNNFVSGGKVINYNTRRSSKYVNLLEAKDVERAKLYNKRAFVRLDVNDTHERELTGIIKVKILQDEDTGELHNKTPGSLVYYIEENSAMVVVGARSALNFSVQLPYLDTEKFRNLRLSTVQKLLNVPAYYYEGSTKKLGEALSNVC